MKQLFLLVILFFVPSFAFASDFSDLQTLCSMSDGTYSAQPALVLPHIDKRITKAIQYTKLQGGGSNNIYGAIFLHANTFTDDYKFLGSYLLRYDCLTKKTDTLTKKLTNIEGLGFRGQASLQYISDTNSFVLQHAGRKVYSWVYDIDIARLRYIQTSQVKVPRGTTTWITPDIDSYDGRGIDLEVLYYKKQKNPNGGINYIYDNYGNPDIVRYTFR